MYDNNLYEYYDVGTPRDLFFFVFGVNPNIDTRTRGRQENTNLECE